MRKDSQAWIPGGDNTLIYEFLPGDNSRQTYALREALHMLASNWGNRDWLTVLDLGCGSGASYDFFSTRNNVRWVGLDIIESPEIATRTRRALPFCAFDGIRIPFADSSFDMVYSRQVFEHVRYPERLLSETHRVLKPGGVFVGSTSHLEPFHSRSYWNYTPYGFCHLLREAGFDSMQVRPGIDAPTLICRRCFGYIRIVKPFETFFKNESPFNLLLETTLRLLRQPVKRRSALKLVFAGHFCFFAQK